MKKLILCISIFCVGFAAFGVDLSGLDRWITGFPKGKNDFAGHQITGCVVERTGAVIILEKDRTVVRLSVIKPVTLEALEAKYLLVEKTFLVQAELQTGEWGIKIKECEISLGLQEEINVSLEISSFLLSLNRDTIVELVKKLKGDPAFVARNGKNTFTYSISFEGIPLGEKPEDAFPGWTAYARRLKQWFGQGISSGNQAVLALIYETSIRADTDETRRIVLARDEKSNTWIGMDVDYLSRSFLSAEEPYICLVPFCYNTLDVMATLDWRHIGDKSWLAKPFVLTFKAGGFFEFNARYFDEWYSSAVVFMYSQGGTSFLIAYGPMLGVEFSAMIPRIIDNKYTGDLFGMGLELLIGFNVPYFFPDYSYENFANIHLNFTVHVIPVNGIGLDAVMGLNFALATPGFDDSFTGLVLNRFGVNLGVRMKLELYNFYKADAIFE